MAEQQQEQQLDLASAPIVIDETVEKPKLNVNVKDCPVRAVKVYNSLAEVTRLVTVQLVPGEQFIVLEKIPRTSM